MPKGVGVRVPPSPPVNPPYQNTVPQDDANETRLYYHIFTDNANTLKRPTTLPENFGGGDAVKTQAAINEFLQSRRARNSSAATVQWYEQRLRPFTTSNPELPEEPRPIETFLAMRHGEPETIHADFRALKALFRFRTERYGVPNPMATVKPPRCPKKVMATLEPEQQLRLLIVAGDIRAKAIVTLLIDTGIRTSEALGLRRQDIKTRTLIVRGKSGQREVAMSEETRELLLTLINNDGKDEYVFHDGEGVLSRYDMYKMLRRLYKKAGIPGPKLGGHRLRHAFGKSWVVNGGDVRSLQLQMGHANISTTEKYCSLTMNDTIAKHERFTPLRAQVFLDANVVTNALEGEIPVRNERGADNTCLHTDYHQGVRCSRQSA